MNRACIIIRSSLCIIFLLFNTIIAAEKPILPNPVIVDQTFFDLSERQNFPNLIATDYGLSLFYQTTNNDGSNIKSVTLYTDPQFLSSNDNFLLDSSYHPYQPTAAIIDDKQILFWYEKSLADNNSDTLFQQQLITFQGESPTGTELEEDAYFYFKDNSFDYDPQFHRVNDRLYCKMLRRKLSDPKNNLWELSLRSLDWETSDLYTTNLHFSANGKTTLTNHGGALFITKSWIVCSNSVNLRCVKWAVGYKGYKIVNNRIEYIYAFKSYYAESKEELPTDIETAMIHGQQVFCLKQSRELVTIDPETMRFDSLFEFSDFATNEYQRIIPVASNDYGMIILEDSLLAQSVLLRFDNNWNFVDSTILPFNGTPKEISNYVYLPKNDLLAYSYSTQLFENDPIDRIMLQSVIFNKELVLNPGVNIPSTFQLSQNFPNPFNPSTIIKYAIPTREHVSVDIYNITGQKVSTLVDVEQQAGEHRVEWNAHRQSSGIYFIKVSYGDESKSIKTMLLK